MRFLNWTAHQQGACHLLPDRPRLDCIGVIRNEFFPSESFLLSSQSPRPTTLCHNTDTEHWCSSYHNYHDLAVQLCTEALSRYPAHNSARLTICVLGEWVVSTWGLLSVCSAFNGLNSENEMAASKTKAFWCPAGLLQEQGPGACSAPIFPSNYLFSMTSEACKQFCSSAAVWMTFTGGRSPGQ